MSKGKVVWGIAVFGVLAAVTSVVAQSRSDQDPADREARRQVFRLGGGGSHIGVTVRDVEATSGSSSSRGGVRIESVRRNSPADEAGLREGDVVVEVDGESVRSARQFARLIEEAPEGRRVALAVARDGQRRDVEVTPEARAFVFGPDGLDTARIERDVERGLREIEPRLRDLEPRLRELEPRVREFVDRMPFEWQGGVWTNPGGTRARLGVQVDELTPQLADYFGVADGGVLVTSVSADSAAAKAGVKAGDVIVSVDGDRVRTARELTAEVRDREGELTLSLRRDKQDVSVKVMLAARTARDR